MSYDVHLIIGTGGAETVSVWWRDHTSNTAGMWRAAGLDLAACDGAEARRMIEPLTAVLAAFDTDPARFEAMSPPNGWGTFATCRKFLADLLDACRRHPACTLVVHR